MEIKIDLESAKINEPENKRWKGMGMVSANNSSRLLIDYKSEYPEKYYELLSLMFDKNALGIVHLKIEMGSDINSSSGTEPCTMRFGEKSADVTRGVGFVLAADAKKVNPDLKLDMLWWSEPLWVELAGDGKSFDENGCTEEKRRAVYEARYLWYKENLVAAYRTYGIQFDYVSATQNERGWYPSWIKYLSRSLKSDKNAPYDFSKIKIVAGDEVCTWNQSDLMISDKALFDAVDVIGSHYTSWSTENTLKLRDGGKEVWMSEGSSPMGFSKGLCCYDGNGSGLGGLNGVLDVANRIITMYAKGRMTLCEFQPVVAAYYDGVCYCHKQFITANTPWSGYYELDPGFFAMLHFSQFVKPGWTMIDGACEGDGKPAGDGHALGEATYSFLTGCDLSTGDFSCVITNTTQNPLEYEISIPQVNPAANATYEKLFLYETTGCRKKDMLKKSEIPLSEKSGGNKDSLIRITIKPASIITLSTLDINPMKQIALIATGFCEDENTVLPLPYTDDFSYAHKDGGFLSARGGAPLFTTDQSGAFEVIQRDGENVLEQKILLAQKANEWGWSAEPVTTLGDDRWLNYSVEIDVKFDEQNVTKSPVENYAGIGLRCNLQCDGKNGLWLSLSPSGKWTLYKHSTEIQSGKIQLKESEWQKLKIVAYDSHIQAFINEDKVCDLNLLEKNVAMQGAGRACIYSAYFKNQFKNLVIEPIGDTPYISRYDNLEGCFSYTQSETSRWTFGLMESFKDYKRTVAKGTENSEFSLNFTGPGFNLTGTTDGCTLEVGIDNESAKICEVGKTCARETFYFENKLENKPHKARIKILKGNLNVDSCEILMYNHK